MFKFINKLTLLLMLVLIINQTNQTNSQPCPPLPEFAKNLNQKTSCAMVYSRVAEVLCKDAPTSKRVLSAMYYTLPERTTLEKNTKALVRKYIEDKYGKLAPQGKPKAKKPRKQQGKGRKWCPPCKPCKAPNQAAVVQANNLVKKLRSELDASQKMTGNLRAQLAKVQVNLTILIKQKDNIAAQKKQIEEKLSTTVKELERITILLRQAPDKSVVDRVIILTRELKVLTDKLEDANAASKAATDNSAAVTKELGEITAGLKQLALAEKNLFDAYKASLDINKGQFTPQEIKQAGDALKSAWKKYQDAVSSLNTLLPKDAHVNISDELITIIEAQLTSHP